MSDYQPQVGDRVSLTGTVERVSPAGRGVRVMTDGGVPTLVGVAGLTLIERPKPAEEWQPGDVVRNADDPEDTRMWFCADDTETPWARFTEMGIDWGERDALPANLLLLVRDGQPVVQPQPHPQPGDAVTEEPPVGSVVRDREGDEALRHDDGWVYFLVNGKAKRGNPSCPWAEVTRDYSPLSLVRWGAEQ